MRADRDRIHAHVERVLHRPADQPVHDLLGAGQLHRLIVTEQQRLGLERQVAVGDGDPQRRRSGAFARLAAASGADVGRRFPCGRDHGSVRHSPHPQQPAIGQALARIHAVQRLLPAEERVDEKVRGFARAKRS